MRLTTISRHAFLMLLATTIACDSEPPDDDAGADADGDVDADGDGDADGDADADVPEAGPRCASDRECDDLVFCNGEEECAPDAEGADDFGCLAGFPVDCDDGNDTTIDTCSETRAACVYGCPDEDGDGFGSSICIDEMGDPLGDDCDDDDPNRYPGNVEVCDDEGIDEDCDPTTVGEVDEDGDGFVSDACFNIDGEVEVRGPDCDDGNPDRNPDSTEFCDVDGIDEDCDGQSNEGLMQDCYLDADGDGFAAAGTPAVPECKVPGREFVDYCPERRTNVEPIDVATTDCDDADPDRHPGAEEICDGVDNDCDGTLASIPGVLDESDRDGDGFVECRHVDLRPPDCADDDARAFPGQSSYSSTPIEAPLVPVARVWDFDCNGSEEQQHTSMGSCLPAGVGSCSRTSGWLGSVPDCGDGGLYVTGCASFSSGCNPPRTESRDAACR